MAPKKSVPPKTAGSSSPAASTSSSKPETKKNEQPPKEFVLKMSHLMDSGLMFFIPFGYGLYMGHDPLRLAIGFGLQALVFIVLTVTVYGPFYPSSFHRAWDLVYRYQDLKTSDVMLWDSTPVVDVTKVADAPPPNAKFRWILRLVLRKASGFHLLVALSSIDSAFFAIPLVTMSSYYMMIVDKTGLTTVAGVFQEIQKMIQGESETKSTVPLTREETLDEIDARQLKEIREGLDTTFCVGAPVAAASVMVWWLGERGKTWSQAILGF
ncbi:hypothetical protein BCR33DRAFT_713832 [Rhizoclosmatium globosum]|uniref:Uncharacterized protein n=1 Tax=Rhizoclosmatium globosum TaxID=329046 RepID=A0A1Y2CR63_9FUNG|nr:hypothetical protein BCR33DRAFT_713832 [Rhizoclosmatium globosum]|eukprot:ORY49528.1 hypothetical protein BCR33DRAFT_713832 [Rhizoclosmatium globosum]